MGRQAWAQKFAEGFCDKDAGGVVLGDTDGPSELIDLLSQEKRIDLVTAADHCLAAPPQAKREVHLDVEDPAKSTQEVLVVAVFEEFGLLYDTGQGLQCEVEGEVAEIVEVCRHTSVPLGQTL